MEPIDISHSNEIFTVSRLNRDIRYLLEDSFPCVWIEGEISNFSAPYSGHWYFCLKDATAQVKCAMFRQQNRGTGFVPKDGMQVLMKARVSLYEGRGDYQLLVDHLEEAGEGRLRQEFEALKKRLQEAGLFDSVHKKSLPLFPKAIGVVTSATGAAIRDILSVLKRRFASAAIIIYPTMVQGELAAANIAKAIQIANRRNECDVIILARGGGSLEDLWSFNEEIVAQAIFQSTLPIISGVGHEIDFTIADFVADVRAPTPSAAAELVTPAFEKLLASLLQERRHLVSLMQKKLQDFQQKLGWANKDLQQQHPKRKLREQAQRLDLSEVALLQLQNKRITAYQAKLHTLSARLLGLTPQHKIRELRHRVLHDARHLKNVIIGSVTKQQQLLGQLGAKLDALSPLSTLQRGFAIATLDEGQVLHDVDQVQVGDRIQVRLLKGSLRCQVVGKGDKS